MSRRARPGWRRVDGIVLLDKPAGLSSNQALMRVRRIFRAEKGGHTGALDPLATGLLPICLGEATKIAGLLLAGAKAYRARVQLGVQTDTDDAEGQAVRREAVPDLAHDEVVAVLARFHGRIQQVPPRYAALKRDGEPLYRRARRGEAFEPDAREVEIRRIDLLGMGQDWLELEVECGSGTYIRSLARDIGAQLGCGGHITVLHRLWVEPFRSPRMYRLEELEELAGQGDAALHSAVLPLRAGLPDWPGLMLDEEQVRRLRQGQRLELAMRQEAGPSLAVSADGEEVGLVDVDEAGIVTIRRLFIPPPAVAAGTG